MTGNRVRALRGACAWLALAVCSTACGGKYEEPDGGQTSTTGDPAPASTDSSSSSSNPPGSLPTHPLGTCVTGFDRSSNPNRACPWVTQKGECFSSFDAACNCLCPTNGMSVCSGGFSPGSNGATTVYCDK
jgi:hypothetical protein